MNLNHQIAGSKMQPLYNIDFHLVKTSLAIWILIIPIAMANGVMRNIIMEPLMKKYALPVSGITLCAMIITLCWFLVPYLGGGNHKTYIIIGILWVILSVVFECVMGVFMLEASWTELLAAYNPVSGNLWLLVLVCIGISPWIIARMQSQILAN